LVVRRLRVYEKIGAIFWHWGIILSVVFGYLAISGEITGKTFFYNEHANPGATIRHRGAFVSVSRGSWPTEFRRGNNFFWALGGFSIVVAGIGIYFCRGIDDYE
jgi:hypothetical protein